MGRKVSGRKSAPRREDPKYEGLELAVVEDPGGLDWFAISRLVIPMLLDPESRFSDREICERVENRLGITFTLRELTTLYQTEAFQSLWPLSERVQDPRVDVARRAFADMVPLAVQTIQEMLANESTPPTVRMRLAEKVLDLNAIDRQVERRSDTRELMDFFRERGVANITQINIGTLIGQTLGADYEAANMAVLNPTPENNLIRSRHDEDLGGGSGESSDEIPAQENLDVIDGEFEEN